jgi:putative DNA primase/helicase
VPPEPHELPQVFDDSAATDAAIANANRHEREAKRLGISTPNHPADIEPPDINLDDDPTHNVPHPADDLRHNNTVQAPASSTNRRHPADGEHQYASSDAMGALADGYRATDVGNSNRLVKAGNGHIRYVADWSKWIVYNDGVWTVDSSDAAITELAKQVARRMLRQAGRIDDRTDRDELWKWGRRSESAASVANMIRLTRGIPGVIVGHAQLDADPWILNVLNGTVDLRTGQLRPHNPADLCTMQAPVMFDETASAPLWTECLHRWQPDPDIRSFLQRAVGTGITGHPVEALFVNVGNGANGKSKFFGAIANALGAFCVTPHKSLLVASKHEGHPTHVASLFRARMLIAPETAQDERLSEDLVKNLTGGDALRARRMHEDEWTFKPTHTAFVHTNYRPRIRGVDEGIWRRVRLIEWNTTIPASERDEHLADKLRAESSGILNWLIVGALEYSANGLAEPPSIRAATDAYRADEDHVGKFIAEMLNEDPRETIAAGNLRDLYEQWALEAGETAWSAQRLARALEAKGFDSARIGTPTTRTWLGIGAK